MERTIVSNQIRVDGLPKLEDSDKDSKQKAQEIKGLLKKAFLGSKSITVYNKGHAYVSFKDDKGYKDSFAKNGSHLTLLGQDCKIRVRQRVVKTATGEHMSAGHDHEPKKEPTPPPAEGTSPDPEERKTQTEAARKARRTSEGEIKGKQFSLLDPRTWTLKGALAWGSKEGVEIGIESIILKHLIQPFFQKTSTKAFTEIFGESKDDEAEEIVEMMEVADRMKLMSWLNSLNTYQRKDFINTLVDRCFEENEVDGKKVRTLNKEKATKTVETLKQIASQATDEDKALAAGFLFKRSQDFTIRGIPHHIESMKEHFTPVWEALNNEAETLASWINNFIEERHKNRGWLMRAMLKIVH